MAVEQWYIGYFPRPCKGENSRVQIVEFASRQRASLEPGIDFYTNGFKFSCALNDL